MAGGRAFRCSLKQEEKVGKNLDWLENIRKLSVSKQQLTNMPSLSLLLHRPFSFYMAYGKRVRPTLSHAALLSAHVAGARRKRWRFACQKTTNRSKQIKTQIKNEEGHNMMKQLETKKKKTIFSYVKLCYLLRSGRKLWNSSDLWDPSASERISSPSARPSSAVPGEKLWIFWSRCSGRKWRRTLLDMSKRKENLHIGTLISSSPFCFFWGDYLELCHQCLWEAREVARGNGTPRLHGGQTSCGRDLLQRLWLAKKLKQKALLNLKKYIKIHNIVSLHTILALSFWFHSV